MISHDELKSLRTTTIQIGQQAPVTVWSRTPYVIDPAARARALDELYKLENWATTIGSEIADD